MKIIWGIIKTLLAIAVLILIGEIIVKTCDIDSATNCYWSWTDFDGNTGTSDYYNCKGYGGTIYCEDGNTVRAISSVEKICSE